MAVVGIYMWLQHKLSIVNYVIVVCSTGARFKSVTNRRIHLEQVTSAVLQELSYILTIVYHLMSIPSTTSITDYRERESVCYSSVGSITFAH